MVILDKKADNERKKSGKMLVRPTLIGWILLPSVPATVDLLGVGMLARKLALPAHCVSIQLILNRKLSCSNSVFKKTNI